MFLKPIGDLTEVARHTTQPIYVDGKTLPVKICVVVKEKLKINGKNE